MRFTKDDIKEIITKAVAISGCRDGSFRYYLSAGEPPQFYAIVEEGIPVKPIDGCKDL